MTKTHEVLRNIDENKLIEHSFYKHPLMVNKLDDDMTIGQIKSNSKLIFWL